MRYTGPLGKSFEGDKQRAMDLQSRARVVVGRLLYALKRQGGLGQQYGTERQADGSVIHAYVLSNIAGQQPLIRTWIESPIQHSRSSLIEQFVFRPFHHGFFSISPYHETYIGETDQFPPELQSPSGEWLTPIRSDGKVHDFLFLEQRGDAFYCAKDGWTPSADFVEQFKTKNGWDLWRTWPKSLIRKRGSMFSGEIRKVVQLLQGGSLEIPYECGHYMTHGIFRQAGKPPWVIEVTQAGVSAWPLPHARNRGAEWEVGGLPYAPISIATLPSAEDRRWLLDAAAMQPFYEGGAYSPMISWAFSASGREAQHICLKGEPNRLKAHRYKLAFSADGEGGPVSATLTEEHADWVWSNKVTCQILFPQYWIVGPVLDRFDTFPSQISRPNNEAIEFPVYVFYIDEEPQIFNYFCNLPTQEGVELTTDNGEVPLSYSEVGVFYTAGGLRSYDGAYMTGVPGANNDPLNRTVLDGPRTVTKTLTAYGSSVGTSGGIFPNPLFAEIEIADGWQRNSLNYFTFIVPFFEREAFYYYEATVVENSEDSITKTGHLTSGDSYYRPANLSNWIYGEHPEGQGFLTAYKFSNGAPTGAGQAPISYFFKLNGGLYCNPAPNSITREEGTVVWLVTSGGTPITTGNYTTSTTGASEESFEHYFKYFYVGVGGSLVAKELEPDTRFVESPFTTGVGGSPEILGAWQDVFSRRGYISKELEIGYSDKLMIGSLGDYSRYIGTAAVLPGVYHTSGWFGVPFPNQ